MNLSAPFIARPVATTLLTAALVLGGIIGFRALPVAPMPQVDFPTISVQASLPGASPDTMASTVATPLERSLGLIAGLTEMTSSSSLGSTRVILQFDLSRDIDGAARDVQAAINAARVLLPSGMPSNPTYRKVNPADSPVIIFALTSKSLTRGQMYDAASTVLAQRISQVDGVGQVSVGGGALPAVRVDVDLPALQRTGLSLEDVRTAIATANVNRPKGMIEDGDHSWIIGANDQGKKAADYLPLIVSWRNGGGVRLGDVARVRDSVENIRNAGVTNGVPSIVMLVFRQPGANIIETAERVKALMPQLKASVSPAIDLDIVGERTTTIRTSLREAERTLVLAVALVTLVVFFFLRDWRSALVPAIAVPVSLVGTFAAMKLLGYSLNNLTLMALTVATGFVVDDAIVVLENIVRLVEQGQPPLRAALRGARQVGFTVVSMSLSLIAVFFPVLAMGGIVGRYFREFAATLSVAILISLVVSLTTTPMMASLLLRRSTTRPGPDDAAAGAAAQAGAADDDGRAGPAGEGAPGRFWAAMHRISALLGRLGTLVHRGYARSLDLALHHPAITLVLLALTIAGNIALYIVVPKGLFPQQETGMIMGGIQADQSISFQAMTHKLDQFVAIVGSDPGVAAVNGYTGGGQANGGYLFVALKPLSERGGVSGDGVINRLRPRLAKVAGAALFLQPAQDLRMGGRPGNAQYQYTLQSDNLDDLRRWEPKIRQELLTVPELRDVNTDTQDKGLQTRLVVDRESAARMQVPMSVVDSTLDDAFGQRQVSTIFEPLNQYHVVEEADPRYLAAPDSLADLRVTAPASLSGSSAATATASNAALIGATPAAAGSTGTGGASIPISAFAHWELGNMPLVVNHQGQFAASTISFNLAPGVSLGQATQIIDRAMTRIGVPANVTGSFQGTAKVFQQSLASQPLLVLLAIFAIYIVLGILYENAVHPVTILSTLPSAGVGALLALLAFGTEFTIMAFIGVILLIGIVKKNAIMMIDVAIESERTLGLDPREAIRHACLLRLRPILMTTLAALLGAIPLALGGAEGTELRQPLGLAVVGGLLLSQLLTLYTTPVVYLALERLRLRLRRRRAGAPTDALPKMEPLS